MNYSDWKKVPEFLGSPTASPEKQVEFLMVQLRLAHEREKTLRLELETMKANQVVDEIQLKREIDMLDLIKKRWVITKPEAIEKPVIIKKKSWWRFWG